jgi:hypothetical protein
VAVCGGGKIEKNDTKKPGSDRSHVIWISLGMLNRLKYGLILCVLMEVFIVLMNLDFNHPLMFFSSQAFTSVAVSSVFIFLAWQALNNRFKGVQFLNREKPRIEPVRDSSFIKTPEKRLDMVFILILIGYTFSFAFSLMVMIFLFVAYRSGTGVTRVVWDHFGEMTVETVLFAVAFFFVVLGYYHIIKRMRKMKRETKQNIGRIYDMGGS